jgi:simple sugar transport system permease protein
VGLSASIAFRVRFWNLGIEGQMIFGGIGATLVSLSGIGSEHLRLPLMAVGAVLGGLAWVAVPALLKLKLNLSEIISTLLLNYIALDFLYHLLYGAWKDPVDGFPHSALYGPFELLPVVMSGISSALVIAAVATVMMAYLTSRSRAGIYMRFIGASPSVSRALGIPLERVVFLIVLLSGALAALAGFVTVAGQEGRLTQSFFRGFGVSGVLIGFLARNNPVAAAIVAILMAILFVAGQNLQVFYSIPQAMVQLIQALIVICVASSDFLIRHRISRMR